MERKEKRGKGKEKGNKGLDQNFYCEHPGKGDTDIVIMNKDNNMRNNKKGQKEKI